MQRAQHVVPLETTLYHQSTNTVLQACSMKVWNINLYNAQRQQKTVNRKCLGGFVYAKVHLKPKICVNFATPKFS